MMAAIKNWTKNIFDWYRLTAYFLFLIIIFVIVQELVKLDRGIQLDGLRLVAFRAAIFSLLLSALKQKFLLGNKSQLAAGFFTVFLSFLGGVIAAFTEIGNLSQPFRHLLQALFAYLGSLWQSLFAEVIRIPDSSLLQEAWAVLGQAVWVLFGRLRLWVFTLPEPAYDPVSLNLIWAISVWLVSIWIYWFVVRNKWVLTGIFPALLIVAHVYRITKQGIHALFWVLGFALILEILAKQAQRERVWRHQGVGFSGTIRKKAIQNALLLSFLVVTSTGIITSPDLDELIKDIKERRRVTQSSQEEDGASQAVDREQEGESLIGPEEVLDEISFGRFPNKHLIGGGPELAETEIMFVRVENEIGQDNASYYFRSAAYESYTLHGWLAVDAGAVNYHPGDLSLVTSNANENLIYQEVSLLEDLEMGNLMFTVGELAVADVPYYASFHSKLTDDSYVDLFAAVTDETHYTARSIVPYFGEDELRNSSLEYPDWVTSKYLQIPDTVPNRVYELALRLTVTQPTPYDRALAIEQYLRGFEYTLDLDAPPANVDIVDYFIFDLQKGYCDYFATSMVVLARAAGLPARLVTGYLGSTYDADRDQFIVTGDQAHSWVEIYFTDYGWVTFEPTAGKPALERLLERQIVPELQALEPEIDPSSSGVPSLLISFGDVFALFRGLMILTIGGLFAAHWIDRWALQALPPRRMFARIYYRLRKLGKRLGINTLETDTPFEFSGVLAAQLARFGANKWAFRLVHSAPSMVVSMITACNQAAYAEHMPDDETVRWTIDAWGRLRWQIALARILLRWTSFTGRIQGILSARRH